MTVELHDIVERVDELPVLPSTTLRLVTVLGNTETTMDEIIGVIQYDQNLTAQVLKLCNSAYFGLSRQIESLRDAISYLGSKQILQLVFGVHCKSTFSKSQSGYGLVAGMLWKHSSGVALAAEKLSLGQKKNTSTGLIFTAGLLHDIGKVILDQLLSERYREVIKQVEVYRIPFNEAEHSVLGFSHEEVGEMIANQWKLPKSIAAASRHHHAPENYDGGDDNIREVVEIVHLADSLVMSMGIGIGDDGLSYSVTGSLAEKYGLSGKRFDEISSEVLIEVEELEELYNAQ